MIDSKGQYPLTAHPATLLLAAQVPLQRQHTSTRLPGQALHACPFQPVKLLNHLLFKDLVTPDMQYGRGDSRSASPFSPQSSLTFITQSMNLQMSLLALSLPFGHNLLRLNHQVIKAVALCAAISPPHYRHCSESLLLHVHSST